MVDEETKASAPPRRAPPSVARTSLRRVAHRMSFHNDGSNLRKFWTSHIPRDLRKKHKWLWLFTVLTVLCVYAAALLVGLNIKYDGDAVPSNCREPPGNIFRAFVGDVVPPLRERTPDFSDARLLGPRRGALRRPRGRLRGAVPRRAPRSPRGRGLRHRQIGPGARRALRRRRPRRGPASRRKRSKRDESS